MTATVSAPVIPERPAPAEEPGSAARNGQDRATSGPREEWRSQKGRSAPLGASAQRQHVTEEIAALPSSAPSSDRPRAPCTRTARDAPRDMRRSESGRSLVPKCRIPRTGGTRARRTLARRRHLRRPRETSRDARARCGAGRYARRRADDTRGSMGASRIARHPAPSPRAVASHSHRPPRVVTRSVRVDGRISGTRSRRECYRALDRQTTCWTF